MIYNAFPSTTGEVEEGSINGTAEVPFKEIGLKGNTSQESTTGKNFLDVPNPYSINGVVTAISLINTIPAGTYTISCGNVTKGGAQNPRLRINDYFIELSSNLSFTITIPSEITSAYFYSNGANYVESQGVTSTVENLMISTSGGDYEPYTNGPAPNPDYPYPVNVVTGDNSITIANSDNTQSQTYPINLGSMELCKIGDYQDYLYKENGNWYLKKEIGKVVLDGSEDWNYNSGNSVFVCSNLVNYSLQNFAPYCNNYKGINIVLAYKELNNNEISFLKDSSNNRTLIKDTRYTINSDLQTWLSTHNTIVYYVLATPTYEEITDTTLIEQLDNLEKAYSYDTQTNISQTNQDKPFIISYEAILSLRNVLNS